MVPAPFDPELFARAAAADIEAVAGVKLFRAGKMLRGECPVCGSGKGKRADGPFWLNPATKRAGCFAGGCEMGEQGGDAIDLEWRLRGGSKRDAAERLAGGYRPVQAGCVRARVGRGGRVVSGVQKDTGPQVDVSAMRELAMNLAVKATPAGGADCPVRSYLAGRRLVGPIAEAMLANLFLARDVPWGRGKYATAMMAKVSYPGDGARPRWTGGVHCTAIMPDGAGVWRKAGGEGSALGGPSKRMFGPQAGPIGQPGGVWLITPSQAQAVLEGLGLAERERWAVWQVPLVLGEGIESSGSAAILWARACGARVLPMVAAALSLNRLQGGWKGDPYGRYDFDAPASDGERPAFTWPGLERVMVAVDRDMKPLKNLNVRGPGGRTMKLDMDTETRVRVCGSLARQAWQRAGCARVEVIQPGPGRDFNDELLSEGAG